MIKKVIWTALVTAASAGSSMLAVRGVHFLWRALAKESPPEVPRWARILVGGPVRSTLFGRLRNRFA